MKRNSKGFTLIEVIIAVTLLAICIIPAFQSFITSSTLNKRSRQMMYSTEICETINEGFANKRFKDVKDVIQLFRSSTTADDKLEGSLIMSSISDNYFNKAVNTEEITTFDRVVSINIAKIQYNNNGSTGTVSSGDAISGNNAIGISQKLINDDFYANVIDKKASDSNPKLYYWMDDSSLMACLCYSNVEYGPNTYDVVISFLPTAEGDDDKIYYYSYSMCTSVFHTKGSGEEVVLDGAVKSALLNRTETITPKIVFYTGMRAM